MIQVHAGSLTSTSQWRDRLVVGCRRFRLWTVDRDLGTTSGHLERGHWGLPELRTLPHPTFAFCPSHAARTLYTAAPACHCHTTTPAMRLPLHTAPRTTHRTAHLPTCALPAAVGRLMLAPRTPLLAARVIFIAAWSSLTLRLFVRDHACPALPSIVPSSAISCAQLRYTIIVMPYSVSRHRLAAHHYLSPLRHHSRTCSPAATAFPYVTISLMLRRFAAQQQITFVVASVFSNSTAWPSINRQ